MGVRDVSWIYPLIIRVYFWNVTVHGLDMTPKLGRDDGFSIARMLHRDKYR